MASSHFSSLQPLLSALLSLRLTLFLTFLFANLLSFLINHVFPVSLFPWLLWKIPEEIKSYAKNRSKIKKLNFWIVGFPNSSLRDLDISEVVVASWPLMLCINVRDRPLARTCKIAKGPLEILKLLWFAHSTAGGCSLLCDFLFLTEMCEDQC